MHDMRVFSHDQLRKIARAAGRETDLLIAATEKFLPYDKRITVEVTKRAIEITKEAKEEAARRGLSEIKSYEFRKGFIQNYSVS
jgi:hypothetical protein